MGNNPILLVTNNGYGVTLVPAEAILKPGDDFVINDKNDGSKTPVKVLAVVPVGTPIDVALADQTGQSRPLMMRKPQHSEILYVVDYKGRQVEIPHSRMTAGLAAANAAGLNDDREAR